MKKIIVAILVISLLGLSYVQYRFLMIGIRVSKSQFDQQISPALKTISSEMKQDHELTHLLSTVVSANVANFNVSLDTVRDATTFFLNDYLADRLLKQNITTSFSFAMKDLKTDKVYLQSANFQDNDKVYKYYKVPIQGIIAHECYCSPYLIIRIDDLIPHLFFQLNNLTIPSLIFMLIIAFCFGWLFWLLGKKKKLDDVKNDFINNLAHEIKTPIFSISLATTMLEKTSSPEQVQKYARMIRKENEQLKMHVEKVLELASLENQKQIIELHDLDVHDALLNLIAYFDEKVQQRDGQLYVNLKAENSWAAVDLSHFSNAIHNLLDNALKYSPDAVEIYVNTFNKDGKLHISIQDQGQGISRQYQKQVFQKFFRVRNGDLHDVKGFGLGLSYVNEVVQRHNGSINIESELGKGSIFTIVIPVIHKMKMTPT